MGHIGPWLHGIQALLESDPEARRRALAEGEAQLANCVSHNHIFLREVAIDAALDGGDWEAVAAHADKLRRYTADEPLPLSDFIIARGHALARFGQGERGDDLRTPLDDLARLATGAEMNVARAAIDAARQKLPQPTRTPGPAT